MTFERSLDMHAQYQMREEPSVHYMIDVIKAAKAKLPESNLTKEELKAFRRYSAWIQKLTELERDRKKEIDTHALILTGPKRCVINFDFICIEWATRRIRRLDSRIMSAITDPSMERILAAGTDQLRKNPHLESWRERQKERNHQDYLYRIITEK